MQLANMWTSQRLARDLRRDEQERAFVYFLHEATPFSQLLKFKQYFKQSA